MEYIQKAQWIAVETYSSGLLAKEAVPGVQICLQTLIASAMGQQERFVEAIDRLKKTVAYSTTELGLEHPNTLEARFQLAALYSKQGSYDLAIPVYRALLPSFEKAYGPQSIQVSSLLRNTSTALHWVGNFADALPNDVRTLQILAGLRPGPSGCGPVQTCQGIVGRAHVNLAYSLVRVGRGNEALPHVLKGVALQQEGKGANHPDTLDAQLAHATVLIALGRVDEARAIQGQVVQTARQQLGDAHALTRKAIGDFSASSRGKAELLDANQSDVANLAATKEKLGANHPSVLLTTVNLVERYIQLQQFAQALALAEEGVAAMISRTDTLSFDDRSMDAWMAVQSRLTNAYIFLLMKNNRVPDALLVTEFLKYRKLSQSIQGATLPDAPPALTQEIKDAGRKLALLDQRIALARSLGQASSALESERSQVFLSSRRLSDVPAPALPSAKAWPRWIRNLVGRGETVVSYKFLGGLLMAFVVSPHTTLLLTIDDQDRVRSSVEAYRLGMRHAALRQGQPDAVPPVWRMPNGAYRYAETSPVTGAKPVTDLREVLQSLSDILLKEVLTKVGPQPRLLISVDQNLGHVPFDSL
ncbi:MAG: tetratricopeptide repeat protein, partial [Rhodoferax sp.]|nr:tetratricopeptide repeat protein [Rhodoferax sp.]